MEPEFAAELEGLLDQIDSDSMQDREFAVLELARLVVAIDGELARSFGQYLRVSGMIEPLVVLLDEPLPAVHDAALLVIGLIASATFDPAALRTCKAASEFDAIPRVLPHLFSERPATKLLAAMAMQHWCEHGQMARLALKKGAGRALQRMLAVQGTAVGDDPTNDKISRVAARTLTSIATVNRDAESAYSMHRATQESLEALARLDATLIIQAGARRLLARRQPPPENRPWASSLAEAIAERRKFHSAALLMQTALRRRVAQRRMVEQRGACRRIQAAARLRRVRADLERERQEVRLIMSRLEAEAPKLRLAARKASEAVEASERQVEGLRAKGARAREGKAASALQLSLQRALAQLAACQARKAVRVALVKASSAELHFSHAALEAVSLGQMRNLREHAHQAAQLRAKTLEAARASGALGSPSPSPAAPQPEATPPSGPATSTRAAASEVVPVRTSTLKRETWQALQAGEMGGVDAATVKAWRDEMSELAAARRANDAKRRVARCGSSSVAQPPGASEDDVSAKDLATVKAEAKHRALQRARARHRLAESAERAAITRERAREKQIQAALEHQIRKARVEERAWKDATRRVVANRRRPPAPGPLPQQRGPSSERHGSGGAATRSSGREGIHSGGTSGRERRRNGGTGARGQAPPEEAAGARSLAALASSRAPAPSLAAALPSPCLVADPRTLPEQLMVPWAILPRRVRGLAMRHGYTHVSWDLETMALIQQTSVSQWLASPGGAGDNGSADARSVT
ncbi:hypothetical protein EMIHUDRAFT_216793 [Emiliania huxleyi CCMP1516]|uniref:TOG domain-containing protein n=2 Tax=Emiliania huxleyi TaxID=2903 RepID=A0A0D3ICK6_EMIH1|nr:hypothetical protein EMIHUDRAFT_216793 [Emiliania huxleyi CCMP1516]EOD08991.1 hypothetical protein EMIHUDRAFT_216793 [Emiliania huxleyi CCMP1516]|eukprot:XP_005761420.1 hypothetical protein EMIHUDRAFT_216793 [Emiliania huxleyi CCMP1516]